MAQKIRGITIELGADTDKFQKEMREVNKSLYSTEKELKDVDKLLKFDPKNTQLLAQKQDLLKKAIGDTDDKLKKEKEALEQLKKADKSPEVEKQMRALERQIVDDENKMEKFNDELKDTEKASSGVEKAKTRFKKFGSTVGKSMKVVGKGLKTGFKAGAVAVGAATTAVAGFAAKSVQTGMDFDKSMSQVKATSGATEEEFAKLSEKAKEMGATTAFSASESADAFNYMAMAGWKTEDMINGISGVMSLAAASGEDLATTSDILTDALTAFGQSAGDSGRLADIMAAAASNANTNVGMMGETFKYAAPVAGSLGATMEDTAVAIGLMANAGIKSSQAGTALRTGLTNLVKPSDSMAAAMEKYGIELQKNADGTINLRDSMVLLRENLGGLSNDEQAAAAAAIFGKNAMSGWLSIVNASDEDFNKLTSAIDNSSGAAQEMANVRLDNLSGDITLFKSALEGVQIGISDGLNPTLRDFVQTGTEGLSTLSKGFQEGGLVGGIGAIGTILSDIVNKIVEYAPQIIDGGIALLEALIDGLLSDENIPKIVSAVIVIVNKLVTAIVDNLPPLLKAAIAIIIELSKGLTEAMPKLIPEIVKMIIMIVDILMDNLDLLITAGMDLILALLDGLIAAAPKLLKYIPVLIVKVLKAIGKILPKLWKFAKEAFKKVITPFKKIHKWFGDKFKEVWKKIKEKFNNVGKFFGGIWDTIKGKFSSIGTKVGNAIGSAFSTAINGAISLAEDAINAIPRALNKALDAINKLLPKDKQINPLPEVKLPRVDFQKQELAKGGLVTGATNAIIGEGKYNEAVLPLGDPRTVKLFKEALSGVGTGGTVNQTINVGQMSSYREAYLIKRATEQGLKRMMRATV